MLRFTKMIISRDFISVLDEFRERYNRFKSLENSPHSISFQTAMTEKFSKRRPKPATTQQLLMSSELARMTGGGEEEGKGSHEKTTMYSVGPPGAPLTPTSRPPHLEKEFLLEASTPGGDVDVCRLCNVAVSGNWGHHSFQCQHRIASAIFSILLLRHRGQSVEYIFKAFSFSALVSPSGYYACPELVGKPGDISDMAMKLRTVLAFLRREHVLKYSMNLLSRRQCFEQIERIGDLVLTPIIHDVLGSIFDVDTPYSHMPILAPSLSNSQTHYGSISDGFLASNQHLEFAFDRLDLAEITEATKDRLEGKTKADVMEAILGELQLFLWACEAESVNGDWSKRPYSEAQHRSLITLAEHAKNVLVGLSVLVFLRSVIENGVPLIQKFEKQFENSRPEILKRIPVLTPGENMAKREFRPILRLTPQLAPHSLLRHRLDKPLMLVNSSKATSLSDNSSEASTVYASQYHKVLQSSNCPGYALADKISAHPSLEKTFETVSTENTPRPSPSANSVSSSSTEVKRELWNPSRSRFRPVLVDFQSSDDSESALHINRSRVPNFKLSKV